MWKIGPDWEWRGLSADSLRSPHGRDHHLPAEDDEHQPFRRIQ